jgi:asparagine synthase (glutamine-hydrolysing)
MCGIVGMAYFDREKPCDGRLLDSMVQSLDHRGPDDRGTFIDNGLGLGMTRLSIIDLLGGHQPIFNEDNSIVIVFNGEIYNFKELHGLLEASGHRFKTRSDTEVILHAYEELGADCALHLNGIFAFAIWDIRNESLLLARDHLGVKPLYYWLDKECIIFASEIKAILRHPVVERRINPQGLRTYLAFGHSIAPETIFSGIKKLLPGHRLLYKRNQGVKIEKYWDVPWGEPICESSEVLAERLRHLIDEIIGMQLISDVPLGGFLSGGIDSSSIVALMTRKMSHPVKTFSVGFQQASNFYNELDDSLRMAKFLHTDHHVIEAQPQDLIRILPDLVYHYDEPFADAAAFPTYLVAQLARKHVKVVLTGDGADEIFGGYLRYGMDAKLAWTQSLPAGVLHYVADLALPWVRNRLRFQRGIQALREKEAADRAASWYVWFTDDVCREVLNQNHWQDVKGLNHLNQYRHYYNSCPQSADRINCMMYSDLKTQLVDSYLEKVDKATMAVGLEARVPFLDYRLVELAFRIPASAKVNQRQSKIILRQAMQDLLPSETLEKPKHGFAVPLELWMRGELRTFAEDILFDRRTQTRGFFNTKIIKRYFQEHVENRACWSTHLWFLIIFELWCRTFLDDQGKS